jgi:hypothetical protein
VLPDSFFAPHANRPRLRIAVLADEGRVPRYLAEAITYVERSAVARVALIVRQRGARRPARPSLGYRLYRAWDERRRRSLEDPATPVELSTVVPSIETIDVTPIVGPDSDELTGDGLRAIGDHRLDVIVDCGLRPVHGPVLQAARYGVWRHTLGDPDGSGGGAPLFWEVRGDEPVSAVGLERIGDVAGVNLTLGKVVVATAPGASQVENRHRACWAATTLLVRALRDVQAQGEEFMARRAAMLGPAAARRRPRPAPGTAEMARWLGPYVTRRIVRSVRRGRERRVSHWRMAVRVGGPVLAEGTSMVRMEGFRWIDAPHGRFFADPFLVEAAEARWLFFEDLDYASGRGRISCAPIGADGVIGDVRPALERPYHLSYPYVFAAGNDLFMIPETRAAKQIELYRCHRFPDEWQFDRALMPIPAVDSSLWIQDGRYWLFTTVSPDRVEAPQLWLFTAESLAGPWRAHPESPLSTDVRTARCAGAIVRRGGKLIRPSQDGSRVYGRSFTLNEITDLAPDRYSERRLVTVGPEWSAGLVGTHSYAVSGAIEVVDGCRLALASAVGAPSDG